MQSATITRPSGAFYQYYTYDSTNRLFAAAEYTQPPSSPPASYAVTSPCSSVAPAWCEQENYDTYGNRSTGSTTGLGALAYVPTGFDPGTNRNTGGAWSSATYSPATGTGSYDASGNVVLDGSQTMYSYDLENRQLSANGVNTYAYDGDGRRVSRTTASGTTTYVYDATGELTAEYGGGAQAVAGTTYLSVDNLGSTRLVTSGANTTVNGSSPGAAGAGLECRDYLPFGEILTAGRNNSCASSDRGVAELFTGKERDAETGLDNFLARYFSSAQGRFMSPDPIGNFIADAANPQSWNMYSYVRNNPLANVDPTGMTCVTVSHPDETTNQADNGDGQGCSGAGVSQSKLRNDLKGTPLVNNSDIKPQDFEFVYGGSGSATFASAALLGQFLTGTGHDNRIYDKQTVETQNLLKSGGIKQISNRIEQACASGQTMNPLDSNGLPPELSTPEAAKSLPYDALHSPVGVQVGGYRYTWQAANSGVDVQINNVAGANSFFYHGPKDRPATGVGPFRSINQRFDFNLPIKCGN